MTTIRAVSLVLLVAAASGCSGGDEMDSMDPAEGNGVGDEFGANNTTEEEVVLPPPQEVLNTTLDYPRGPGQPDAQESFTIPADAFGVRIWYQAIHDCPTPSLGYQDEAQLIIEPPSGEARTENLFDSGAGTVDCNNQPQKHQVNPEPVPGEWTVRTSGVYSGSVSVAVVANPPGAA